MVCRGGPRLFFFFGPFLLLFCDSGALGRGGGKKKGGVGVGGGRGVSERGGARGGGGGGGSGGLLKVVVRPPQLSLKAAAQASFFLWGLLTEFFCRPLFVFFPEAPGSLCPGGGKKIRFLGKGAEQIVFFFFFSPQK